MKRRTLLRRLGATGIATATITGTATATTPQNGEFGVDRAINVSDLSGEVDLAELLDADELARLGDDVDLDRGRLFVREHIDLIVLDRCCQPATCTEEICSRCECCWCPR